MSTFLRATTAVLLFTAAIVLGQLAMRQQTTAQWVAVMLLAVAGLLAFVAACAAAAAAAWTPVAASMYERRQRGRLANLELPPSQTLAYRAWYPDPLGVEYGNRWEIDRARYVDCGPRHAAPAEPPARDGLTVPLPIDELVDAGS